MSKRIVLVSALAATILFALASAADAHVSISPASAPKGSTTKLSFLVPNEEAKATVTKVQVAFPVPPDTPIPGVAVGQKPGWRSTVKTTHLAKPITTDDGTITDIVSEIDWVAITPASAVKPGEFGEFTIDADGLPGNENQVVFKAVQTYSNGKITRWIDPVTAGDPEPEHPTPILELTAPGAGGSSGPATTTPVSTGGAATVIATTTKDNSARALGAIGIALGAVALVFATGALIRKRRAS
jgi:periplasmic copper chaperone A